MKDPVIFLTDNGSLRPAATFALRRLAAAMTERLGKEVEPVSLLHSHKIPADALGGEPATIVKRRIREWLREGKTDFVVLPLFLGPSLAIVDYLPEVAASLREECAELQVHVAKPLAGDSVDRPDPRLAEILRALLPDSGNWREGDTVALVDHGTPIQPVNALRNSVARQLAELLGKPVQACSMERREGDAYAFNEPLLENLGSLPELGPGHLWLAMFFLLPGRHAGAGGDVASIVDDLVEAGAFERVTVAPLMAEEPRLLDILEERYRELLPRV